MKYFYLFIVTVFFLPGIYVAQPLFIKKAYFGGPSPYVSVTSNFLLPSVDNTVLNMGTNGSLATISKLDSTGNWLWTRSYHFAPANLNAMIVHAAEYPDSTLAITGFVYSIYGNGNPTAYCAKLKSNGDTLWCRAFTNNDANAMVPHGLSTTLDSGLVVCGQAISSSTVAGPEEHTFIARFTKNGSLSWIKTLSTSYYGSNAYSIKQTADSGYVIAGCLESGAGINLCASLLKLDKTGNISWHKRYCELANQQVDGVVLDITEEKSGYLCAINSGSDVIFLKTDFAGQQVLCKKYLYTQTYYTSNYKRPVNFRKLSRTRRQLSFSDDYYSSWILALDTLGTVQWQATANLSNLDMVQLKNKSQVLIGNRELVIDGSQIGPGDIGIIITDSLGSSSGECYLKGVFTATTATLDSTSMPSTMIVGGTLSPISVTVSTLLLRVDSGCMLMGVGFKKNSLVATRLYPNPSQGKITLLFEALTEKPVTVSFSDITGRVLLVKEIAPGKSEQELDLSDLPPALYLCSLTMNGQVVKVEKLIISE